MSLKTLKYFIQRYTGFASRNFCRLRIDGLSQDLFITVHDKIDTEVSATIRDKGIWEPDETRLLINALEPGHSFIDIGANIGYFSLLAAVLVGEEGSVLAFEPDPSNYALLQKNIHANNSTNVYAFKLALSDQASSGHLYLNDSNLGDHQIFSNDDSRVSVPIEIKRADDVILPEISRTNFIKIDTQGSEFHVLRGMSTLLQNSCDNLGMLIELSPNSLSEFGVDPHLPVQLMVEYRLEFYLLKEGKLVSCSPENLHQWIAVTQMDADSEGFMNLFCCSPGFLPPGGWSDLPLVDLDPLDVLLGGALAAWNGHRVCCSDAGEFVYLKRGWDLPSDWGIRMNAEEALINFKPAAFLKPGTVLFTFDIWWEESDLDILLEVYINEELIGSVSREVCAIEFASQHFEKEMVSIRLRRDDSASSNKGLGLAAVEWRWID
ncbi:FkbM family methyltransferase [Halieaceae bacterium IMCC14734]|uniref:FkbM family methyltransferase n=1 Tax=Candidatus Litorirhabdus singularis TaxID=2518993 RepID=A0ABT3TNF5_9GAMM|nr:FkbM family methyltransferase [Candidatus Litorirhabdus singularis]MCX2983300.1 FkbM family methyltransferase [Candidatus Litorirhabdus singularis]